MAPRLQVPYLLTPDEFDSTFYNVLEVPESASPDEIREAYLLLVRVWHPDHHQSSPKTRDRATEKLKIVNAAYKTLIDPDKRAEYDRKLILKRAARSYVAGTRDVPISTPGLSRRKGGQHFPQLLRWFRRPWLAGALLFVVLVGLGALISIDDAPRSRALITAEPQQESQTEKLETREAAHDIADSHARANSLPLNRKTIGVRQNAMKPIVPALPDSADFSQKSDSGAQAKVSDLESPEIIASGVPEKPDPAAHVEAQQPELRRVSGDLGIMSGYIATNSVELAQLRNRRDRNITEFRISKTRKFWKPDVDPQMTSFHFVGDIGLLLKSADPKQMKFTLDIMFEGKVTEKENRKILEPLQFYVQKSLYEIVISSIGKNDVSGYLSSPKY